MELSVLYNFIFDRLVLELKEKIEQTDDGLMKKHYLTDKEKLEALLDDVGKEQFKRFLGSMENWFEYLYDQICTSVLNMGVKIGMELQESFDKFREQELI